MKTKNSKYNTFIGSIPGNTKKEDIIRVLNEYTKVIYLNLATKTNLNGIDYCLGFGHALLEQDPEEVGLINADPPIVINGRIIKIKKHLSGKERNEYRKEMARRRVFLLNIPKNTRNIELANYFSKFAAVDSTSIIEKIPQNKTSHFGFVVFENEEDAEKIKNSSQKFRFKNTVLKIKPYDMNYKNRKNHNKDKNDLISNKKSSQIENIKKNSLDFPIFQKKKNLSESMWIKKNEQKSVQINNVKLNEQKNMNNDHPLQNSRMFISVDPYLLEKIKMNHNSTNVVFNKINKSNFNK